MPTIAVGAVRTGNCHQVRRNSFRLASLCELEAGEGCCALAVARARCSLAWMHQAAWQTPSTEWCSLLLFDD